MFGRWENARKAKKMKQKEKNGRTYNGRISTQKLKVKVSHSLQGLSLYGAQNKVKYQHTLKKHYTRRVKRGENHKSKKKKQKRAARRNSGSGKEISHQCKIFAPWCEIFALWCEILCLSSFSASAPSFLLNLICNVEFDSNSSCLDQLDNLGINSLQKLQN